VPLDTATWGNLMTNAEGYFATAPLLAIAPGLVITIAVVSVNFIGDALRDALDPARGRDHPLKRATHRRSAHRRPARPLTSD
jgi:ABC-type dipeptide/oligopeptide/nickel transport system permease subunit